MESSLVHKIILVLALVYTGLLTWGSLTTIPPDPDVPVNFDKWLHLAAYFGLTILWLAVLWRKKELNQNLSVTTMILVVFAAIVYGIIIEFLQGGLTEDRMTDIWDALANSLGALLGVLVFALFINKSRRLKSIF